MLRKLLRAAYLGLILLFLYAPIFLMVVYSFNKSKTMGYWTGFTLNWYVELFRDPEIMRALYITLVIAVLSAIISTVIGTLAAIGIHSMKRSPQAVTLNVSYLPMLNPDIVTGVSLMVLFLFLHLSFGFGTLLLAHITFNIPYVIFSVMPKLKQMNQRAYEAALDLGANPWVALWKVILPEIRPGILTGALLAFTLSLDDFVISFFTTSKVQNLSIMVYSMARRGINPKINALSAIMFICVLLLLLLVNRRTSRNGVKRIRHH